MLLKEFPFNFETSLFKNVEVTMVMGGHSPLSTNMACQTPHVDLQIPVRVAGSLHGQCSEFQDLLGHSQYEYVCAGFTRERLLMQ